MKRFLVSWPVMLLAVVFVASCGKESSVEEDVSQYFIKCKIGSVDKTFKYKLILNLKYVEILKVLINRMPTHIYNISFD